MSKKSIEQSLLEHSINKDIIVMTDVNGYNAVNKVLEEYVKEYGTFASKEHKEAYINSFNHK